MCGNYENSADFLSNLVGNPQEDNEEYYDFFTKYRLESEVEELDMNDLYNQEEKRWILQPESNVTPLYYKSLKTHADNQSNCIIFIHGLPNSGKSEMGQTNAFILKTFLTNIGYRGKIWVFFDIGDVAENADNFRKGDIIIVDEMPELVGEGAYVTKKAINNIVKIVRAFQLFFIYISPEKIKFKVINYYLEMMGKCKKERTSRLVLYSKNYTPVGHIVLPLHSKESFREKYESEKMENIKKVLQAGGNVSRQRDSEKLERDVKELLKLAKENGVEKKGQLEFLAMQMNMQESNKYVSNVINGAFMRIEKGTYKYDITTELKEEKEEFDEEDMIADTEKTNIVYYDGMTFAEFVYEIEKQRCSPKVALARKMFIDGISIRSIAHEIGKSEYFVQDHSSGNWRSEEVGYMLEKYWAKVIDASIDDLGGNTPDKPDLLHNGEIYSLKYRYKSGHKDHFSKEMDLGPEYRYAKKNNKKFHIIYYNNRWDNSIRDVLVDPNGTDDAYVYKDDVKQLDITELLKESD